MRSTRGCLWLAAGWALAASAGCGPAFSSADEQVEPDSGGVGPVDAAENVSQKKDAAADGATPAGSTPCGTPRTGDAPVFDRETCIGGGTFMMGSDLPNLGEGFADHTPAHQVTLSAYFIDSYEVTVGRYRGCVHAGACKAPPPAASGTWTQAVGGAEALPITELTWDEAEGFCQWDGGRTLPTEARWEYAARGPGSSVFPWGDDFSCYHAVLGGYNGGPCLEYRGPLPLAVGVRAQSAPGATVYDLVGNAAEWVADYAGSYPAIPGSDPSGAASGTMKLVRGGSWVHSVVHGFGYARMTAPPEARGPWGFRCSRSP